MRDPQEKSNRLESKTPRFDPHRFSWLHVISKTSLSIRIPVRENNL